MDDNLRVLLVLFFFDAMHPGTCRLCKNGRVSKILSVNKAQTDEFFVLVDYNYCQH